MLAQKIKTCSVQYALLTAYSAVSIALGLVIVCQILLALLLLIPAYLLYLPLPLPAWLISKTKGWKNTLNSVFKGIWRPQNTDLSYSSHKSHPSDSSKEQLKTSRNPWKGIKTKLKDSESWRVFAFAISNLTLSLIAFILTSGPLILALFGYPILTAQQNTFFRFLLAILWFVAWILFCIWNVNQFSTALKALFHSILSTTSSTERINQLTAARQQTIFNAESKLKFIERSLHDGIQARIVAVAMLLGQAKEIGNDLITNKPAENQETSGSEKEMIQELNTLVTKAHQNTKTLMTELRQLARGIRPPILDLGLLPALESFLSSLPMRVNYQFHLPRRPSGPIETIVYFSITELLNNVMKHAQTQTVSLVVEIKDNTLHIEVTDQGQGGAKIAENSTGLAGLRDRLNTIDGTLKITSPPGGPTNVTIEIPMEV